MSDMTTDNEPLFPITDSPAELPPIILGRSEVEEFYECAARGYFVEHKLVSNSSTVASAGTECHRIIAEAIKARSVDLARNYQLVEMMKAAALHAPPNIQQEVIASIGFAVHYLAHIICFQDDSGDERDAGDLQIYAGGEGDHSGQISSVLIPGNETTPAVWGTCEMDLVVRTRSKNWIKLYDMKTGHTPWTATKVGKSFQFGTWYPDMLFRHFPDVERISISVIQTRDSECTPWVDFVREKDFYKLDARMMGAVRDTMKHRRAKSADDVPTTPALERCPTCPAVLICNRAHEPAASLARDREAMVRDLVFLETKAAKTREVLKQIVDAEGDLVFSDVAFGRDKPKADKSKTPPCDTYKPLVEGNAIAPPKSTKRPPKRSKPDPAEDNDSRPGDGEMAQAIDAVPFVPTPLPTLPDISGEGTGPLFQDKDIPY